MIYFALFLFQPKFRESLYCALFMAALSLLSFARHHLGLADTVAGYIMMQQLLRATIVAFTLFGLFTFHAAFGHPPPRIFRTLLALGLNVLIWSLFSFGAMTYRVCAAFGLIGSLEIVRVTVAAMRNRENFARLVLAGPGLFGLTVVYNAVRVFELVRSHAFSIYTLDLGVLAAALGLSLCIARRYAITPPPTSRKSSSRLNCWGSKISPKSTRNRC